MDKKIIIAIVVVVLLIAIGVGGYLYLNSQKSKPAPTANALEEVGQATDKIIDEATKGALPSLSANPLENKPDVNPAAAANPIKNIKTNPFE